MGIMNTDLLGVGVGTLLADRYEIEEVLGKGGMGAVFGVRDKALGRERAALKILDPRLCETLTDVERFKQEVLISRRLSHENIVRTFEFGQLKTGQSFVVMEYVKGKSLETYLLESPGGLSLSLIVNVLNEVAKGMAYAHQNGVVHRDLKPGNILVTPSGQVKIVDFGLARSVETQARLTQTGECVGTPMYMAPEQVRGQAADFRADVYGLGVVAFEIFLGRPPYPPDSWFDLANSIVNHPIPKLSKQRRNAPAWFEAFVEKCCQKNPADRFQSMVEVQEYLAPFLAGSEEVAPKENALSQVIDFFAMFIQRRATAVLFSSMALVMLVLTVGLSRGGGEGQAPNENRLESGTQAVEKMVDTLTKLNQAVQNTVENSEKIDRFLAEQKKFQENLPNEKEKVNAASKPSATPTPKGK